MPSELGFQAEFNRTAGLIAKYIKRQYGYDYSIRGITGMLDRMGLSYMRPTYVPAKADAEIKRKVLEEAYIKVKIPKQADWNEDKNLMEWLQGICK